MLDKAEVRQVGLVLRAFYDSVLEAFLAAEPAPGVRLDRLKRVQVIVDPKVHDTPRHFAATHENGLTMRLAPELAHLAGPKVLGVIAHELGHAADFLYPGHLMLVAPGQPARWREPVGKHSARRLEWWYNRSPHEVELTADAVALLMTGALISYAGDCKTKDGCKLVQTLGAGEPRPEWLR